MLRKSVDGGGPFLHDTYVSKMTYEQLLSRVTDYPAPVPDDTALRTDYMAALHRPFRTRNLTKLSFADKLVMRRERKRLTNQKKRQLSLDNK